MDDKSLANSIYLLSKIQQIAHLGSWELDLNTNKLIWSDEVYRIFGFKPRESDVNIEMFKEFVHPDDLTRLNTELVNSIRENKNGYETEYRIIQKNSGELKFVYEKCEHIRDNNGEIVRSIGLVQDVTERKKLEAELKLSREHIRILTENIKDVAWILDVETMRFLYVSPSVERLRGYKPEEIMSESFTAALNPEVTKHFLDLTNKRAEDLREGKVPPGTFYINEVEQPCKDGSYIWTEVITSFYINPENGRMEIHGVTHDISERKKADDALIKSELRFRNLLNDIQSVSVQGYTPDGTTFYWNKASELLYGYSSQEAIGRNLLDLIIPPMMRDEVSKAISYMAVTGQPVPASELQLMRKDGTQVPVYSSHAIVTIPGQPQELFCLDIDLTLLKQARQLLIESQTLLNNIINSTTDIIYVKNNEGKYTLFNKASEKVVGINADRFLGKDDFSIFPDEDARTITKWDRQIIEEGLPVTFEEYLTHADGSKHTYLTTKGPLYDKIGKKIGIFGIARDITKRKQIEKALIKSEEQFRTIVSNMGEGFGFVNDKEEFVFANRAGEEIFGVETGGLLGKNLSNLVTREQFNIIQQETNQRIQGTKSVYELEILRPNGEKRNLIITAVPYFENDKVFVGTYGVFRDITEQKKYELQLKDSEEKYRYLIEFAVDGILTGSAEGYILDANSHFCLMAGRHRDELIGKHITSILTPISVSSAPLRFDLLNKGEIVVNERDILRPDGKIINIEMRTKLMPDNTYQSIFRDITTRKISEQKIQDQNKELLKLNADKDLFMSIVGHDLKSPFNSLLGLSEILKENIHQYDIHKIEDLVNYINKSAQNAYSLLEALLLWSRSQSGKIPFEPLTLRLYEVCFDVQSELRIMYETKNIAVGLHIPESLFVAADVDMLKTVLRNLLSNAVKFTRPGGKIVISAVLEKTNVVISVTDNGVGIEPAVLSGLFDVSRMNSTKGTDGESGTGLGLALCKDFVEKHSGKIWVESTAGKGSTFKVSLPLV